MRILAFDTSGNWCSVAFVDSHGVTQQEEPVGNAQSERLLPIAHEVLQRAGAALEDIDAIAFGAGPGSFTGVRIAASVAQGLALGLERPVIGVCTLEAIAWQARHDRAIEHVIACTDARMGEVYIAAYEWRDGRWNEASSPAVLKPEAVQLPSPAAWVGCGNGFAAYPTLASRLSLAEVLPDMRASAEAIAEMARMRVASGITGDPAHALPLYVRHRVALTTAEREAGLRL